MLESALNGASEGVLKVHQKCIYIETLESTWLMAETWEFRLPILVNWLTLSMRIWNFSCQKSRAFKSQYKRIWKPIDFSTRAVCSPPPLINNLHSPSSNPKSLSPPSKVAGYLDGKVVIICRLQKVLKRMQKSFGFLKFFQWTVWSIVRKFFLNLI